MDEEQTCQDCQDNTEPHGEEVDYKALYEQEKAYSSKWEKRAKANKAAADELVRAQETNKTADERIAELTRRLDEKEQAEQRAKMAARVATEKGVPADLLVGETEEDMAAWADRLITAFKAKPAARIANPGTFAAEKGGSELAEFARKLLNN